MRKIIFITLLFIAPFPAYAYIGPGLGLGAIAAVLGVLLSIFLALVAILWYPIKRLIKGIRGKEKSNKDESE